MSDSYLMIPDTASFVKESGKGPMQISLFAVLFVISFYNKVVFEIK
jgi:hypothetical protein